MAKTRKKKKSPKKKGPPPALFEEENNSEENNNTSAKEDDNSSALEVSVSEIPTEEPDANWADSLARKLLLKDLDNGTIPEKPSPDMPTKVIFTSRPEYAEYGYKLFSSRLSNLRKIFRRDKSRANKDEEAFLNYKANNIMHTHSAHGYPEWDESAAHKRLKKDIDDGLHELLTPAELWCFREEYDPYPLNVFRDHIAQEVKTRKFYHSLEVLGKSKMKGGKNK